MKKTALLALALLMVLTHSASVYAAGRGACPKDGPDPFQFQDVRGHVRDATVISEKLSIKGLRDTPVAIVVSGDGEPALRVNGGNWASSGTIKNGQTLELRMESPSVRGQTHSAIVVIGSVADQWDVTTAP